MGVGIMLLNARREVWVGRRAGMDDEAWQMPQGGIDAGETPRDAVIRELAEETGTDRAEIIAESGDWLRYDLPPEVAARVWKGRFRGQRQKWFALRFTGADADFDLETHHQREFTAWRWIEPERLTRLIVPFKRPIYEAVIVEFQELL
jgi:putative (di)nucleoside polyphosphate hydrolase